MLLGPLFSIIQASLCRRGVSRYESDFELPGNSDQCCFKLVVLNVICIWRRVFTRDNLVGR